MSTLNQGNYNDEPEDGEPEVELTDGFTFPVSKDESDKLGIPGKQVGDVCKFIVTATVIKETKGDLTFKANEIEWVYDENEAKPADAVGTSPMYKQAMGYNKPKDKVTYVTPSIQPHVS